MAIYIPVDLRNRVRACDRDRCCYCKTSEALSGIRMAFDHIHPRSKGGETCFENVCLAQGYFILKMLLRVSRPNLQSRSA